MAQVAALVECHAEHRVAGLERALVHGHVRLRPGVRLHIRVLGAEQLLGAVTREVLHLIDDLAATVVALARCALRIFVVEPRSEGLEHGHRREVLGRDELEGFLLAIELSLEKGGELRVGRAHVRLRAEIVSGRLDDGLPAAGVERDAHVLGHSRSLLILSSVVFGAGRAGVTCASNSAALIGPSRTTRGGVRPQSMIEEASPPAVPPSRTASSSLPSDARTASAVVAGRSPWGLALVEASGPVRRSSCSMRSWSGIRQLSEVPWRGMARSRRRSGPMIESAPGQ